MGDAVPLRSRQFVPKGNPRLPPKEILRASDIRERILASQPVLDRAGPALQPSPRSRWTETPPEPTLMTSPMPTASGIHGVHSPHGDIVDVHEIARLRPSPSMRSGRPAWRRRRKCAMTVGTHASSAIPGPYVEIPQRHGLQAVEPRKSFAYPSPICFCGA